MAHVILGHTSEADFSDTERTLKNLCEVEAEAVALLCCEALDLEGAQFSRGYIQEWLKRGSASAIPEKNAQRIYQTGGHMQDLIRQDAAVEIIIQTVLDSLDSAHSRRAYERHLREFIAWHQSTGKTALNKAAVQRYAAELRESGLSAATINQRLSAIRKLAAQASDNGALDAQIASGIKAIKGIRQEGTRTGNWPAKQQAQQLLNASDTSTVKGLRDRAILAVLLGCGLRRAEAANLTFNHIQQRDGRWVLVDLLGKRNKLRSVPMPAWTKVAIDEYARTQD